MKHEKKIGFALGTLRASLLGNLLAGRGVHAGDRVIQAGEGTVRAGEDF